jgi:hypothetical protein
MNLQRIVLLTFFRRSKKKNFSFLSRPSPQRSGPLLLSLSLSLTWSAQVSLAPGYGPRLNRWPRLLLPSPFLFAGLSRPTPRPRPKPSQPDLLSPFPLLSSCRSRWQRRPDWPEFTAGELPGETNTPPDSPLHSALLGILILNFGDRW